MLDHAELDAVVSSTPHDTHNQPTLAALARGLHVLVEKPMALSSQDDWATVDAAEEAGRVLMVGHSCRGQGVWRTVKRMLSEGVIGKVRQINAAVCQCSRGQLRKSEGITYRLVKGHGHELVEDVEDHSVQHPVSVLLPVDL